MVCGRIIRHLAFFFSIKKHHFLFETSSGGRHVTPKTVRIFLDHLLNQPEIQSQFGRISVTLISDESRLTEIYKLHRLKKIRIVISRPNPSDTPESFDKKFSDRLKKQNAQRASTELTAEPKASLKPDEETKELATLALKDGFVEASGKLESGAPIKLSTRDHARIHAFRYARAALSEAQAFVAGCREFLASLT